MTGKLEEAKNGADKVPILCQQFLGRANEFDTAYNEQKKMIICELCDRIKVNWDYEARIVVDMGYGQFCGWKDNSMNRFYSYCKVIYLKKENPQPVRRGLCPLLFLMT